MSSVDSESTYYDDDDISDYYDAAVLGEYTVLTTYRYGYTYILTYDWAARKYIVVSSTNPNIFPKQ
jgi:hypothetical protein